MKVVNGNFGSFGPSLALATEMRVNLAKADVDTHLLKGPDSMMVYCPKLALLQGLCPSWPSSTSLNEMTEHRENTTTLLSEGSSMNNAISNPDVSISVEGCCRKASSSYARLARHLLLVRKVTKIELDEFLAQPGTHTTEEQMKIATYRQFLEWLDDFLADITHARKTALAKLEKYYGGVLPDDLRTLELSEDRPMPVRGVCPGCNKPTQISPHDGDVYVDNERHETCIPFGNALFDSLNADRIAAVVYAKLGTREDPTNLDSLTSVHAFLNAIRTASNPPEEWLMIALGATELKLSLASSAHSAEAPLPLLRVSCPVCEESTSLQTTGKLINRDGSSHACQVPNPLHELRTALTNEGAPKPKKSTPANGQPGAAQLSDEDRTAILRAMVLLPKKNFKTIAARASAMRDMNRVFDPNEVSSLSASLTTIASRSALEESALNSRKNPKNRSTPTLSTPPPRGINAVRVRQSQNAPPLPSSTS